MKNGFKWIKFDNIGIVSLIQRETRATFICLLLNMYLEQDSSKKNRKYGGIRR